MNFTLSMDVYLLYCYVGVVCAAIISIILNRVKSTIYKETIDKHLCNSLLFFISFCTVDALWGIIGSPWWFQNRILYIISSYGFHFMAAWASFVCSGYVIKHLELNKKTTKIFTVLRSTLIAIQMILLIQNLFTNNFFSIDENAAYHSGSLRTVAYILQFCHYIPIIVYSGYKIIFTKHDRPTLYKLRSSQIFSVIPLIFGFLQLLYPDGSFYSLVFALTAVTMYAFNITEQRETYLVGFYQAEEAEKSRAKIEEALEKAEAANKAKTVFLSNMSHDIRTPINGIMGMVTLAKKEEMSPGVSSYVNKIDVASRHLLSLVNDVLDMSRIESGHTEITPDHTDVLMIVDNCYSIVSGQLEGRKLTFNKICENIEHHYVLADVLHLRQILINILGNAVKFTPDDGNIDFITREIAFDGENATFEFIVKDNGIGMKKEFINHIFEAFAQEDGGSRSQYKGTGLGMSISNQLAHLMNGKIDVMSEEGKGSTFILTLPLKVDNTPESLANIRENHTDMSIAGIRIMLVEDNELNMEIAKALFEDAGASVTCFDNGKLASDDFISKNPGTYDAILMDIMMPEMNGYEATQKIRNSNHPEAATIPIIAMTANAFAEDKIKAIESGMNAHTSKPIDFKEVAGLIKSLVRK